MEGKKETILPHIPYPELYAPRAVSYQLIADILGSPDPIEKNGAIATSLDLHRTPKNLTDQDILNAVSTHLGFSLGTLSGQASVEDEGEFQKRLEDINISLEEAKGYIERVLGLKAPSAAVHSKSDIVDLIRKTARYGEPDRKGLETHASYCALVSVAVAVFELHKKEAHMLKSERTALEQFLTEPNEGNAFSALFTKHFAVDIAAPTTVTVNGISPQCQARISMRDKESDSQITKYLTSPRSSAEEALKDGMGIRLEIDNERIEDVLIRVTSYLMEALSASHVELKEKGLFTPDRLEEFVARAAENIPHNEQIKILQDKNPMSADSFRVVKIFSTVKIPGKDTLRSLEIQVVEPGNKNEKKLASHAVYEVKKKIIVMTRLFGGCSEAWLKKELGKISQSEGYADKIIRGLKDDPKVAFLIQLPGTRKIYGAAAVYERWMSVEGLIEDPAISKSMRYKLDTLAELREQAFQRRQ